MLKNKLVFLAILLMIAFVITNQAPQQNRREKTRSSQFKNWKAQFGKKYNSAAEEQFREEIFLKNLNQIHKHNQDPSKGYKKGVNQFTEMTEQELNDFLGANVPPETIANTDKGNNGKKGNRLLQTNGDCGSTPPNAIDWNAQGAVSRVKNQGSCGSCWAFSSSGALEGLSKVSGGTLKVFSEQQLVDCTRSYGNYGCGGGWMDNVFKYVKSYGILQESSYWDYDGLDYWSCDYNDYVSMGASPFKISSFTDITSLNCDQLRTSLQQQPISVAVYATNAWFSYTSGVMPSSDCIDTSYPASVNHGVLLTGVDADGNWIVKNSWGASWGNQGYIKLAPGNTCNICRYASYPNK